MGHDVDRETVDLRHVSGNELDTGLHQSGDEMNIARQAIQFGDEKRRIDPFGLSGRGQ